MKNKTQKLNQFPNRPKVGLGIWIINEKNELLLQKRKGAHGQGTWSPPGGHLELGESFEECAKRETMEEVGIEIGNVVVIGVTNDIFDSDKHYITIATRADIVSGEPQIMEPDRTEEIQWFSLNNLPQSLFLPNKNLFKTNFDCFCGSGKKHKLCCGKNSAEK